MCTIQLIFIFYLVCVLPTHYGRKILDGVNTIGYNEAASPQLSKRLKTNESKQNTVRSINYPSEPGKTDELAELFEKLHSAFDSLITLQHLDSVPEYFEDSSCFWIIDPKLISLAFVREHSKGLNKKKFKQPFGEPLMLTHKLSQPLTISFETSERINGAASLDILCASIPLQLRKIQLILAELRDMEQASTGIDKADFIAFKDFQLNKYTMEYLKENGTSSICLNTPKRKIVLLTDSISTLKSLVYNKGVESIQTKKGLAWFNLKKSLERLADINSLNSREPNYKKLNSETYGIQSFRNVFNDEKIKIFFQWIQEPNKVHIMKISNSALLNGDFYNLCYVTITSPHSGFFIFCSKSETAPIEFATFSVSLSLKEDSLLLKSPFIEISAIIATLVNGSLQFKPSGNNNEKSTILYESLPTLLLNNGIIGDVFEESLKT